MKSIAVIAAFLAACLLVTSDYSAAGSARPAGPGRAFCGRVVRVDAGAATLFVKENGNTVGFDASNPVFSGYPSLSAVRIGDRVAVSYTADGIRVARLSSTPAPAGGEKTRAIGRTADETGQGTGVRARGRLIKRAKRADTTGFAEADVNQDGKITPIGLSVVIKDVTMDEFRQYDKGHKGYLSKAEFLDAVKHLRTGER